MGMLPMGEYQPINMSIETLASGTHTTATANTFEKAGSFTLDKPSLIRVRTTYSNGQPIGLTVAYESASSVGDSQYRIDVPSGVLRSHLSITCLLPAGDYKIYTNYTNTSTNQWNVFIAVFS